MLKAIGVASTVLLVALAGCGADPASAYQKTDPTVIAAQAHAALQATTGIHVAGTLQLGKESATVDLTSDATGAVTGTITLAGSTLQVLGTAPGTLGQAEALKHIYVKAGQDFWGQIAPQAASRLSGKWVSAVTPLPSLIQRLTLPYLIANEARYAWEKEKPTLVGTSSVDGTATVQISVTDGSGGAPEILDVSATDPHHVLRESEGTEFTLTFDQFGATAAVTAPAAADVVDLTQVMAQK